MGKRRELGLVVGRMAPFGRPRSSPAVPRAVACGLGSPPRGEAPETQGGIWSAEWLQEGSGAGSHPWGR